MTVDATTLPEPLCNLCGQTCVLYKSKPSASVTAYTEFGGLIDATVSGGYHSTAGNGDGALDDTDRYRFSLCEFCLDWLFERFVIPVTVESYMQPMEEPGEPWRPAAERVAADDWRRFKAEFHAEAAKRAATRKLT